MLAKGLQSKESDLSLVFIFSLLCLSILRLFERVTPSTTIESTLEIDGKGRGRREKG